MNRPVRPNALSVSAAEFQFDATGVTAFVTPSTTTYWTCACLGSFSGSALFAHRRAIIEDSDGDSIVRWEQGNQTTEANATIEAGSTTAAITIPIHNDTVPEGTESFRVHVWAFGPQDEIATVTILDDEQPPRRRAIRH